MTYDSSDQGDARLSLWFMLLVLGSLWGVSEVVLNDAVRAWNLPARAGILAGAGMLLLGIGAGALGLRGKRVLALFALPVLACLMKQMVIPILHMSVLCKANSCIAVLLQGGALAGILGAVGGRRSRPGRAVAVGGAAGLLSALVFYPIGLRVAPCAYLLSFQRPGGFAAFFLEEALVWAAFSALLFPAGLLLGRRLADPLARLHTGRPGLARAAAAAALAACWAVAGLSIAGF